jgi:glycosyltransferase involved in cell wall biosynthesis
LPSPPSEPIALEWNGLRADGPAQALRDYLVERGGDVVTIAHPLVRDEGGAHVITTYRGGRRVRERRVRTPLRPPASYAADGFVPLRLPRARAWFGFNPLACARALAARKLGRARTVVLWSVDFTPDRFGAGRPATRLYDRVDRFCSLHADARIELSEAARDARNRRHGLAGAEAPTYVVPMGSWLDRVPTAPSDGYERRRVVFLGNLVRGKGVELLLDALALTPDVSADIVGGGELEDGVRRRAGALGDRVRVHGAIPDHRDVERLLASASVAVAPYSPDDATYTPYADPGKLKAYVAAGLPTVLTDVPPNARELEAEAGAQLISYDAAALAAAIGAVLTAPDSWRARHEAALAYARRFDWNQLLGDVLTKLGLDVP